MTVSTGFSSLCNKGAQSRWATRIFAVIILFCLLFSTSFGPTVGYARTRQQTDDTRERAQALLDTLTPEERVGQLFLVTFNGMTVSPESQIYDLIFNHHVGGVILEASNDNFLQANQTLSGIVQLSRNLQSAEWSASQESQVDPISSQEFTPAFIPLFIGISQEGNDAPYDQIINDLTKLPSQMAIGATWQPDLARQVGSVLGTELSGLGINFLLGPSLDVLEAPRMQGTGDLGVRSFGGDPFWVGEMGKAFITGVHEGSSSRVVVVAKHFPGHGSSDRLPEEEVATVRKSLEQLKQIELAPFYAVTGGAPTDSATTDGLLVSHIRYQGLQGNIRETTRPVSLEGQALGQLLGLPEFAEWRANGGVMVSDNLGSPALRKFADPTGTSFPARILARDAFVAGNDLLFLGNDFITTGDPDSYTTILRTLSFFAQKYREDPAFQQQVNESALRILMLKLRLYNNLFMLSEVVPAVGDLDEMGNSSQVTFQVAQQAATLVSPSLTDLAETLPEPPNLTDQMVFISDELQAQQCSSCPEQYAFEKTSLEEAVMRLYGPLAGGQVLQRNLESYSFDELMAFLDQNPDTDLETMEAKLVDAEWIVFSLLNVSSSKPSSQALSRFLAERPDLYRQKSLVVFAFDAPYFLDATEISKLSGLYALYSKVPQFVEVASRLLFGEVPNPPGDLPVTVPGVNYDLISATAPDPDQVIQLRIDQEEAAPDSGTQTAQPAATLEFHLGDTIPVRTEVILDHNGHPVPDLTPVEFILSIGADEITRQVGATSAGIARATFSASQPGALEIRARSDQAINSTVLQIDIPPEQEAPTEQAEPTETQQAPTPTFRPTATPTPEPEPYPAPVDKTDLGDWLLAMIISASVAFAIYWITATFGVIRWGLRAGLLALIGGLLAYTYLAVQLPGSTQILQSTGSWGVFTITLIGLGIGWGAAVGWQKLQENRKR